jgi:hypothetical protein
MGSFKGEPGKEPRSVTPGQKTVRRHGDFGFKGSFVGLDWLGLTFKPDHGDATADEYPDRELDGRGKWIDQDGDDYLLTHHGAHALAPENRPAGQLSYIDDYQAAQYTALMFDREEKLRGKVQLMASVAMQIDMADWTESDTGINGYHKSIKTSNGARIDWSRFGSSVAGSGNHFLLTLPGVACAMMGETNGRKLMRMADDIGGKATRIDMKIDDYERVLPLDEIEQATTTADFVSKTHRVLSMRAHAPRSSEVTGQTIYIGKPTSRRMLRVYDKLLEGGELNCVRWEMEEKKEAAESLLQELISVDPVTRKPKSWATIARGRLVAFVDFKHTESHSEIEKRDRLEWFKVLVENIERAKIYPAQVPKTLDQVKQWVEQQIGPSLRVIMLASEGNLGELYGMIDRAKMRMRPKHFALLATSTI